LNVGNSLLLGIVFSAVLFVFSFTILMSTNPIFAEIDKVQDLKTDKKIYKLNEKIVLSFKTDWVYDQIRISIIGPVGFTAYDHTIKNNQQKDFVVVVDNFMSPPFSGTYTWLVIADGKGIVGPSFEIDGLSYPQNDQNTVQVLETDLQLEYRNDGGVLHRAYKSYDNSIVVELEQIGYSDLLIALPRNLIDSRFLDVDIDYVITMWDGSHFKDIDYREKKFDEVRILNMQIPAGTNQITIKGTFLSEENFFHDSSIPQWLKNNASWWLDNEISDEDFFSAFQFYIKQNLIIVPNEENLGEVKATSLPTWITQTVVWWSEDYISDFEFLISIQWLVDNDFIKI